MRRPSSLRRGIRRGRERAFATLGGALALLLAAGAATVAGCNIGAPAAYAIFGPGQIEAEHELAPVRTVVFVDDRANKLPRTMLRSEIGDRISTDIMSNKLVPNVVATRDAIAKTRQQEDGTKPLSIAAIGRSLECQQVIYVQIVDFTLAGDGAFGSASSNTGVGVTPTAKALVKVIDVSAGERTYPLGDLGGREVIATLREVDPANLRTVAQRRVVEESLANKLGLTIGRLFYRYERVELGENLGPRSK